MIDWATEVIDEIGLIGVALLIALESVIPPIPSELVLLLAGFNAHEGQFALVPAILAATAGSAALSTAMPSRSTTREPAQHKR